MDTALQRSASGHVRNMNIIPSSPLSSTCPMSHQPRTPSLLTIPQQAPLYPTFCMPAHLASVSTPVFFLPKWQHLASEPGKAFRSASTLFQSCCSRIKIWPHYFLSPNTSTALHLHERVSSSLLQSITQLQRALWCDHKITDVFQFTGK